MKNSFQSAAEVATKPVEHKSDFIQVGLGSEMSIALLPDANENNPLFFAQQLLKHKGTLNGEFAQIPCLAQYKDEDGSKHSCPICKVSQAYYAGGDKAKGSTFYRKVEHILNVKVVADNGPINPETGKNQIGKVGQIRMTYQVWNALTAGLADDELSDIDFTDLKTAPPFIIRKTEQGDFANYSTSGFSRKPLKMSDKDIKECMATIVDLSTFVPAQPDEAIVESWLAAAVHGAEGTAPYVEPSNRPEFADGKTADEVMADIRARRANKA